MGLEVLQQLFVNIQEVKAARLRLLSTEMPEPECTLELPFDLTPDQAVTALQHEVFALDVKHSPASIKYVITKNMVNCIFVRIFNDEQELGIHVDSKKTPLDFSQMVAHFRNKTNIKVMLVGGTPGEESGGLLQHILESLIVAPERFVVINQKLLERNIAKESTKKVFVRDLILRKMSIIYRHLYKAELNLGAFTQYPLSGFDNNSAETQAMNTWAKGRRDHIVKFSFLTYELFLVIHEYVMPQNLNKVESLVEELKKLTIDRKDFHKYLRLLISKNLYNNLSRDFENVAYDTELVNILIDIETNRIITIPALFYTPYEALRTVFLHDQHEERKRRYFLAFNEREAVRPQLSEAARKEVALFYKHIDYARDISLFITERGYEFFWALNYLRAHPSELAAQASAAPLLLSYSGITRYEALYQYTDTVINHERLSQINALMPDGVQFIAKFRHYPSDTLDAVLPCKGWGEGLVYQNTLKEKGIDSHVVWSNEGKSFTLVVPGINIAPSVGIGKADSRLLAVRPWF